MATTILSALLSAALLFSQANTWVKTDSTSLGNWSGPALVYAPNTGGFLVTLGSGGASDSPFRVMTYTHADPVWTDASPLLRSVPYLSHFNWPYRQFCFNTDDGKFYFYVRNATFTYDPAANAWDTLSVNTHPNANAEGEVQTMLRWGSLCYDAYNHEIVLFGGGGLDQPQGSPYTWTFTPATRTWLKLDLAVQPPPRALSPMVYDPVNRKIVLFGGDHLDYLTNDTWVYDCVTKTWLKKNPSIRPSPRAGHSFIYMPKSGQLVMLGGYTSFDTDQRIFFEMWRYDLAADEWSLIKRFSGSQTWPKVLHYFPGFCALAASDAGDTLLALGVNTPSQYHFYPHAYRLVYDSSETDEAGTASFGHTRDTVAFRVLETDPAWYATGVPAPDTAANEAFLRNLAPGVWTALAQPRQPNQERAWGTRILDTDRDNIITWSGGHACYDFTDVPQYSIHNNRFSSGYFAEVPLEYTNSDLTPGPFTFNDHPFMACHTVKAYAYDVNIHKMIFAGSLGHTYLYDPDSMDWVKTVHIHNPAAFPTGSQGLYGTGLCATPHGVYNLAGTRSYLFSADSLRWRTLPQSGIDLPSYYSDACGIGYDSKRDRILYVTGQNNTNAKMYEYSFATGQAAQLFPADSEKSAVPVNYWREMAYLPGLDIILFQVAGPAGYHLAYDCAGNRWVDFPVLGHTAAMCDRSTGLMYDAKRGVVFLSGNRAEVWVLRPDSTFSGAETDGRLSQAPALSVAPNPFNPAVSIILNGDRMTGASVKVFDLTGRFIAELLQGKNGRRFVWNASGRPSGVYLVEARKGDLCLTKRIVLSK